MNLASAIILVTLFALVALALWRVWKKGAPCECGSSCSACLKAAKNHSCSSSCGCCKN